MTSGDSNFYFSLIFFILRLGLLTFHFTPWNNVSLYTKILEGLEQKLHGGGGGLSPLAL